MRRCLSTIFLLLSTTVLLIGCENAPSDASKSADDSPRPAEAESSGDEEHHGTDDHAEHEHTEAGHFHLAPKMVEMSRRFAAVWYAGRNEQFDLLDYQIHELEELQAEIKRAAPTENGVDVAARLQSDVLEPLHALESYDGEDPDAFEKDYRAIVKNCSQCHADTGHDYLNVTMPTRNPYPNLSVGAKPDKPSSDTPNAPSN